MSQIFRYIIVTLILGYIFPSCDHGLKPGNADNNSEGGISGYISYQNWPSADSLYDLRLVVFRHYPPNDILGEVISGNAIVYPDLNESNLPFYKDTTYYSIQLEPGTYEYVVVAQQYGMNLTTDWLAAGQYDTLLTDPLPTKIHVESGNFLSDINIQVDFNHLPVQPF
jgi:hypothetical protein